MEPRVSLSDRWSVTIVSSPGALEDRARSLRLQSGAVHPVLGRAFCRRASELELMACAVRASAPTVDGYDPLEDHRVEDDRVLDLASGGSPTAA